MNDERKLVHELRDRKEHNAWIEATGGIDEDLAGLIEWNKKRIAELEAQIPDDAAGTFGIRIMALQPPKELWHISNEICFRICEVHWTAKGELHAYAEQTVVQGENVDEIKEYLQWCQDALTKPIYWGGERWKEMYVPEKSTDDKAGT